jgi:hypothetical protein
MAAAYRPVVVGLRNERDLASVVTHVSEPASHARLEEALAAQRARSAGRLAPEVGALIRRETEALIASGRASQTLQVGSRAPEAELTNALGRRVSLAGLLSNAPLVVNFYRGGW